MEGKSMPLLWRWVMTLLIGLGLLGGGYVIYSRFLNEINVRVAVESTTADDAQVLNAMNEWMVSQGRRYRIRLVQAGSQAEALEMLRAKKVEIASIRADAVSGQEVSSMMVLFKELAVLMAPKNSPVSSWNSLNRRAVGIPTGTSPQDPLLQALLKANGVDDSLLVPIAPEAVHAELVKRSILAVAFVAPMPSTKLRNLRRLGSMRDARTAMNLIEVPDAEALAARDKRYASETIPTGALRPTPALPDEGLDTLSVSRHLIVRTSAANLLITRMTRDFLEATRALQLAHPLLAQAGAPDIEADAFVKVHKGPRAYFNGDDRTLIDVVLEWIYVVPLVFGALGTLALWAYRWLSPRNVTDSDDLVARALKLRREAAATIQPRDLIQFRQQLDQLAGELEGNLPQMDPSEAAAVLSAMDLCDRRVTQRQSELEAVVNRTGRPL